ncbi:Lysine--tRNA ligase [Alphaproteobacteria bacterium]
MNHNFEHLIESRAWPFQEAEKILKKINYTTPAKGYVLFETGYGPSGLPHIGTFGEVVRTTMVRYAFQKLSNIPTHLFCVSDDMDGMRKIPDTIPNKPEYVKYMDLPLSSIPDPFCTHSSFAQHMNARLCQFLDRFEFEYEFKSATECYKTGVFNEGLLAVLEHYDEIMDIMLPTLGQERQKTYSPFLPIDKKTGKVLQVAIIDRDIKQGMIAYKNEETNEVIYTKVTDGHCKLQWKPDFGMRWAVFDVDFEMYGKDHLVNGPIYSKICQVLGNKAPHQMFYELFLDEAGQKISKSKGTGFTLEEWLKYAPQESLSLFMYASPQKAKRLYFDVIPKYVDEYISYIAQFHKERGLQQDQLKGNCNYEMHSCNPNNKSDLVATESKQAANPVYHIHNGNPPVLNTNLTYSLLLNLVSVCNTDNPSVIWGYIVRYTNDKEAVNCPFIQNMVRGAINYYHDFVKPKKHYKNPDALEREALLTLKRSLLELTEQGKHDSDTIQTKVYEAGKKHQIELRAWFQSLYEVLLGAVSGPRLGSFIALYGVEETIQVIDSAINKII